MKLPTMTLPRLLMNLVTVAGIGLGLAALWTRTVEHDSKDYWSDGTMGGFLLALLIICALLLVASIVLQREWLRSTAAAFGMILLGYFLFVAALDAPHLGRLDTGAWFGIAGGILIVVGTAPLTGFAVSKQTLGKVALDRTLALWLLACVGMAMGFVSLFLSVIKLPKIPAALAARIPHWEVNYWSLMGDHSLGIVMLVILLLALLSALAAIVLRIRALEMSALGASLLFLGLALFYPVVFAFHDLGQLGAGSWVALAGALLASSAAALALLLNRETGPV